MEHTYALPKISAANFIPNLRNGRANELSNYSVALRRKGVYTESKLASGGKGHGGEGEHEGEISRRDTASEGGGLDDSRKYRPERAVATRRGVTGNGFTSAVQLSARLVLIIKAI